MSQTDDYLRLLADVQRRQLLRTLLEADGDPVSVTSDDATEDARHRHIHLPKLVDAALIDWDPRNDIVVRGPAFDKVIPLLEAIEIVEQKSNGESNEEPDDGE